MWPGEYNGIQNTVESWGVLEGVNNIPQPKSTEFYPYILGGITQAEIISSMLMLTSIVLALHVTRKINFFYK